MAVPNEEQPLLTIREMLFVAEQAGVLKQFAATKCRSIKVDYVPARGPIAIPRETIEEPTLETTPPFVYELLYTLEDTMFGGTVFACLTCNGFVIINPWVWQDYDHLGRITVNIPK